MTSGTVTVYAITSSRIVPQIAGLRLRALRVGPLTALVASARRAPAPTTAALRRYHQTITAIAAALPAVLPARFGTRMTEPELATVLHLRAAAFRAALKQVSGRVQMTLRLTGTGTNTEQRAAGGGRTASRESGTAYLRSLASQSQVPGFAPIREALGRFIKAERVEHQGAVTSIYHLVPRRSAGAYATAAAEALSASGMRAVVSGPFPAYAFTAI